MRGSRPEIADRSRSWRAKRLSFVLGSAITLATSFLAPQAQAVTEAEVKAVLLLSFAQLSDWKQLGLRGDQFSICVYRQPDFAATLEAATRSERADGREIRILAIESLESASPCSMTFVTERADPAYRAELARETAPGGLVIGETPDFAGQFGAVRVYRDDGRLAFEVDRKVASAAGVRISSRILRRAKLRGEPNGG